MRTRVIPALLFLAIVSLPHPSRAGETTIRRLDGTRLSIEAASKLARETFEAQHVTGAEVAVVDRGQLVWSEAFGMRTLDPPQRMQRTTTTWAASITKGVFATYVMQLVEHGELDLDLPV